MSSLSKARQRIDLLLDENSFVEIGAGVTARATDFNMDPRQMPSDGVITGYGVVNGDLVYVYSQDAEVLGGSIGEMHAAKIARIYEMAIRTGAPVVGLLDSAGMRLQEGIDALGALGRIYAAQSRASGVIPQISGIFGNCGGGLALVAAGSDFAFMAEDARLFVNAPNALAGNREDQNDTAAAAARYAAGNVDGIGTEAEVLGMMRALLALLPCNNEDDALQEAGDDLNRICGNAAAFAEDPAAAFAEIADCGTFLEIKKGCAPEMVCGLARLGGAVAGIVGNRAAVYDENGEQTQTFDAALTGAGCYKAADFVRFCDAFEIPVITLTNVTGFAATQQEERKIADASAKLLSAFAGATVPRINVITGSCVGSAGIVMNSAATGADLTISYPETTIGIMDSALAARILFAGKSSSEIAEAAGDYAQRMGSASAAAARGFIDRIVEPSEIRKYLIGALEVLYTKREELPMRKHSTK